MSSKIQEEDSKSSKKINVLKAISNHPLVVIFIYLITIAALIITIVFHFTEQKHKELLFAINPVRTQVVTMGKASGLEILYNGVNLGDTDINVVQIGIWNNGDLSVEENDILKEVFIYTDPSVNILEAKITKNVKEYDITKFSINNSPENLRSGKIPVNWKILEKNDGAIIQLIYQGPTDIKIGVAGYVKDFGELKELPYQKQSIWYLFVLIGIAGLFIIFSIVRESFSFMGCLSILVIVGLIIFMSFKYFDLINSAISFPSTFGPPFGF